MPLPDSPVSIFYRSCTLLHTERTRTLDNITTLKRSYIFTRALVRSFKTIKRNNPVLLWRIQTDTVPLANHSLEWGWWYIVSISALYLFWFIDLLHPNASLPFVRGDYSISTQHTTNRRRTVDIFGKLTDETGYFLRDDFSNLCCFYFSAKFSRINLKTRPQRRDRRNKWETFPFPEYDSWQPLLVEWRVELAQSPLFHALPTAHFPEPYGPLFPV